MKSKEKKKISKIAITIAILVLILILIYMKFISNEKTYATVEKDEKIKNINTEHKIFNVKKGEIN